MKFRLIKERPRRKVKLQLKTRRMKRFLSLNQRIISCLLLQCTKLPSKKIALMDSSQVTLSFTSFQCKTTILIINGPSHATTMISLGSTQYQNSDSGFKSDLSRVHPALLLLFLSHRASQQKSKKQQNIAYIPQPSIEEYIFGFSTSRASSFPGSNCEPSSVRFH
jgi:hypothetical protein